MKEEMKNWLHEDFTSIESTVLSDTEKRKIYQSVLATTGQKKKRRVWHYLTAAVVLTIGMLTTASFAYPSFATQIPFMQNIIDFFQTEIVGGEDYADYATSIEQVQESNGVTILIEDAIYDGSSITLAYAIQTEQELGEEIYLYGLDVADTYATSGSSQIKKVDAHTYVGFERVFPAFQKEAPEDVRVTWQPAYLTYTTATGETKKIEGDWQFKLKLPKLSSTKQILNQMFVQEDFTLHVTSISENDYSTYVSYYYEVAPHVLKQWPFLNVQFDTIIDDLGNTYTADTAGISSRDNGKTMTSGFMLTNIHRDATTLTLTPVLDYSQPGETSGKIKKSKTSIGEPIVIKLPER